MKNFINIFIETHLQDDWYYTTYNKKTFYTDRNYTKEQINNILKDIMPKQYKDEDNFRTEIDYIDLKERLLKYEIYEIQAITDYCFDIDE